MQHKQRKFKLKFKLKFSLNIRLFTQVQINKPGDKVCNISRENLSLNLSLNFL